MRKSMRGLGLSVVCIFMAAVMVMILGGCTEGSGAAGNGDTAGTTTGTATTIEETFPTLAEKYVIPSALPNNLNQSATGTYNGKTITLRYCGYSELEWPMDNLVPHVFYQDYSIVYIWRDDKLYINYMDKTGKLLNNQLYQETSNNFFDDDGMVLVQQLDGEWVYLDKSGDAIVQGTKPANEQTNEFTDWDKSDVTVEVLDGENVAKVYEGLYPLVKDDKLGLADIDGNVIIPPTFPCTGTGFSYYPVMYGDLIVLNTNGNTGILEIVRE